MFRRSGIRFADKDMRQHWNLQRSRTLGSQPGNRWFKSSTERQHLPVAQLDERHATNVTICRFESCREGQLPARRGVWSSLLALEARDRWFKSTRADHSTVDNSNLRAAGVDVVIQVNAGLLHGRAPDVRFSLIMKPPIVVLTFALRYRTSPGSVGYPSKVEVAGLSEVRMVRFLHPRPISRWSTAVVRRFHTAEAGGSNPLAGTIF
jgi:hypothetical protein